MRKIEHFSLAVLVASLTASVHAKEYKLSKPKNKAERTVTLKEKADLKSAIWSYELHGIAENSRNEIDPKYKFMIIDVKDPNDLLGEPKPKSDKLTVDVAGATGNMLASHSFVDSVVNGVTVYSAYVHVEGKAEGQPKELKPLLPGEKKASAYAIATSQSQLDVIYETKKGGKIELKPSFTISAAGCDRLDSTGFIVPPALRSRACGVSDPVNFNAINLVTSEQKAGNFLSWNLSVAGPAGSVSWIDGILTNSSRKGSFTIDIPGIYTLEQGSLDFEFDNGIVTKSISSGIFSGIMPAAGMSAYGSFDLGDLELNYDFGWGEDLYRAGLNFPVGGGTFASVEVPEPGTWALFIVGFGFVGLRLRGQRGLLRVCSSR